MSLRMIPNEYPQYTGHSIWGSRGEVSSARVPSIVRVPPQLALGLLLMNHNEYYSTANARTGS